MAVSSFHPAVRAWFQKTFGQATPAQAQAWPAIAAGRHALIAAPTGSGKTLAAFLAALDALLRAGLDGALADQTYVLYVSPLKALSNDIDKNLQAPLNGIRDALLEQGLPDVDIRTAVRTGDTPQSERHRMRRQAPHILVTTPESLYILLSADSGRAMLQTVRTVIVDELHALAGNKRGAHLSLSLERLAALCAQPPVRIGLSATQKPMTRMAAFLTGADPQACAVIDTGHTRQRDLAVQVPASPLEAVMANEVWQEIYQRLQELVEQHRTTLIFVNTRRLVERVARALGERIGVEHVAAHHGSLAKEHRLDAEQRLKAGGLRALVATASLELGIDIGDVDLVCQIGSPRSIAGLLQRVGRSGHAVGAIPKGRLFPVSLDDLAECTALLDAVAQGELDRIEIPHQPLDVLAQQIVAEVACREWDTTALYEVLRKADPYRELPRECFDQIVRMLAEGYTTRRGRRGAHLHHDAVHGKLRGRRGARLMALTNGGTIPDQFDYDVILQPVGHFIGSLNEDFAFESLPGDIFQLGNTAYRIRKIEPGKVYVEDARGQPPNLPFWFGEAPGRSAELSRAVGRLRARLDEELEHGAAAARRCLRDDYGLPDAAAAQLADYCAAAKAALGVLPTQQTLVFERFFDATGDMHLVIHSPYGSRLNRAWGLSLRKRFCRKFNFELQAAALEDSIVLSLGPTHSFALDEVGRYLHSASVREVLIQALLDAPMFPARWRWNASIALAVQRNRNGKRLPAQFQRNDAEDLMAVVFPDQLACLENVAGKRSVPDHPLVTQTLQDCLHDVMDVDGLVRLLQDLEQGQARIVCKDLSAPSPLAQEVLNARPYAFLDDAPAEERRTLAVQARRFLNPTDAGELGRLDAAAIAQVCNEAWPAARDADELHDALVVLGFIATAGDHGNATLDDGAQAPWPALFTSLCAARRATALRTPGGHTLWVAAERLAEFQQLWPKAVCEPAIEAVTAAAQSNPDVALVEILRSRLEGLGPCTAAQLAASIDQPLSAVEAALGTLENEGFVLRGAFRDTAPEWCERRLLARMHRYTLQQLRREIEPVSAADYMRFLFDWHHLHEPGEGAEALAATLLQLEGCALPAAAWEAEVLPVRVRPYAPALLDQLCASGRFVWQRRGAKTEGAKRGAATPVRVTPITITARAHLAPWQSAAADDLAGLSAHGRCIAEVLRRQGASFFVDLVQAGGLLRTQTETALAELVAQGWITCDSFAGLRALLTPSARRPRFGGRRSGRTTSVLRNGLDEAGRWALTQPTADKATSNAHEHTEHIARVLLQRYGVVARKVLERENKLPPWRDLLYVYRRWEARGEIRGGRFLQEFAGEQFALPEALARLRSLRKQGASGQFVSLCAADPLNLTGIITPGERVPALINNRILYRDGIPVAVQVGGQIRYLTPLNADTQWEAHNLLLRQHAPDRYVPAPGPGNA